MSASEFCLIESNKDSYYCSVVDVIGPLPSQFEFVYGMGVIILFIMFLFVVYALISYLKALGE